MESKCHIHYCAVKQMKLRCTLPSHIQNVQRQLYMMMKIFLNFCTLILKKNSRENILLSALKFCATPSQKYTFINYIHCKQIVKLIAKCANHSVIHPKTSAKKEKTKKNEKKLWKKMYEKKLQNTTY